MSICKVSNYLSLFGENSNKSLEMDIPDTTCMDLIECTAEVLDGDRLQAIFVSTQQNSLDLPMVYSIRFEVIELSRKQIG